MKFHALMVSLDDAAAGMLAQIFDDLLLDHERCSLSEAQSKFDGKRIDLLALHFDDVSVGESLIAALRRSSMSKTAIALGLVSDPSKVTGAFGGGANFVLYQPLCADNARASLRAAAALLQRERRRQFRVPVQLAVSLTSEGISDLEGIMLDLSEGGMDVLAAQALQRGQMMEVNFRLPPATDIVTRTQVVWANANGQSGLQFVNLSEAQSRQLSCWLGTNAPQSPPDDPEPLSEYTLSDLSLGGCYIETLAPFPKSTRIDICFRISEFEIHLDGTVRLVYPSHGMGVEFTANPEQKELVSSLIDRLSGHPGVKPDVLVWPKGLNFREGVSPHSSGQQDQTSDELVQLLSASSSLSQDEFLFELRRQRISQPEVTTA